MVFRETPNYTASYAQLLGTQGPTIVTNSNPTSCPVSISAGTGGLIWVTIASSGYFCFTVASYGGPSDSANNVWIPSNFINCSLDNTIDNLAGNSISAGCLPNGGSVDELTTVFNVISVAQPASPASFSVGLSFTSLTASAVCFQIFYQLSVGAQVYRRSMAQLSESPSGTASSTDACGTSGLVVVGSDFAPGDLIITSKKSIIFTLTGRYMITLVWNCNTSPTPADDQALSWPGTHIQDEGLLSHKTTASYSANDVTTGTYVCTLVYFVKVLVAGSGANNTITITAPSNVSGASVDLFLVAVPDAVPHGY